MLHSEKIRFHSNTYAKNLRNKNISYIEIVPKQKGRFFEVHYTYEMHVSQMKKPPATTSNALSCDLGVDRLLSCVTNTGDAFLIDGKTKIHKSIL